MPNRDGTGPRGTGPIGPRGGGRAHGATGGAGRGRGLGGSNTCECPKCGHSEPHVRGVPCTEKKCPKCGTPMRGVYCK